MLSAFISSRIVSELPFTPNSEQLLLIEQLGNFVINASAEKVFVLNGFAGTGKTSIMAALVKALHNLQQKTILLAPTGRAAKVFSSYSGWAAYTIHKKIYRQQNMGNNVFELSDNLHSNTLFIVDEASMISTAISDNNNFGSGNLLDDLIKYVYSGHQCSLLLLGDTAQLPPVKQNSSPALEPEKLKSYGLDVTEFTLTQVARQALESGILHNATHIRTNITEQNVQQMPKFETLGFADITNLNGEDVLDEIQRAYDEIGVENTIIITRSNKQANLYNQGIRTRVLWKEDELSNGDVLMVTRNNYFWTKEYDGIDFLANGDILEVVRIHKYHELYGCRFVDLSLKSQDYGWEIETTVLLDSIYSESPEKDYELSNKLFDEIAKDYPEIHNRKTLVKTILESRYYNALHIKLAYAITCHKSQGGQWNRVFIDQGRITDEMLGSSYYRWLYTALTRASEKVFLINFS